MSFSKQAFQGLDAWGGEVYQALVISSFDFFAAIQTRGVEQMRYPEEQLFDTFLYPDWRNGMMRKGSKKSFRCVAMNAGTDLESCTIEAEIINSTAQAKFSHSF